MKRILYLTFYFRPDLCAGSFRNSPLVDELNTQIQDKDIEIDVLTTSPNRYSTYREKYQKKERLGKVTIERIVVPTHESGLKDQILSFKTYFFEVLKRTNNQDYDLVFASSSRFFTSYLGYWIAKRKNIPLFVDTRDLFSETLKGISNNWFIKYLLVPLIASQEKQIYQYASHINLISEGFKESFPDQSIATFSYYTHGVDPVFQEIQKKNKVVNYENPKEIVYAGNIGEGQGLHKIIPQAAKQLENTFKFKIIGDGGARKKLENRLLEFNVKNVELVDPISREEVIEEYMKADILFIHLNDMTIFRKVMPSKIFELAVMEKPILAGVQGYARKFLKKNVNGTFIFDPGDAEGIIQQIREIEKFLNEKKEIDNSIFSTIFNRKEINQKMAQSILSYVEN